MSQHSAESTRDLPGGAGEVTVWLRRWGYGGGEALNEILPEVSAKTVQRDWSAARAWLRSQVRAASGEGR